MLYTLETCSSGARWACLSCNIYKELNARDLYMLRVAMALTASICYHPALLAALVHASPQQPSHWLDFLTIRLCPHSFTFYPFLSQNLTKRNHHSFHTLLTFIQSTGSAAVYRADSSVSYKLSVAWSSYEQVWWLDVTLLQIFNLKQLYLN